MPNLSKLLSFLPNFHKFSFMSAPGDTEQQTTQFPFTNPFL